MKVTGFILFFLLLTFGLYAQTGATPDPAKENLPYLFITTQNGQNIVSWNNQYNGIKSIGVQRSADSIRNFATIGVINAPKKGKGSYKDPHPMVGLNYYRLSIEFGGDLEWFSNIYKAFLDSATIAQSLLAGAHAGNSTLNTKEEKASTDFYFTPSSKIFTNPYTGHINIVLEDATSRRYSIRFFDPSKNEVLRVSRVSKPTLVLDKNNFNSRGIFSFQLFDGSSLVETGYVTIY